jgi:hypothetical protein
VQTTWNWTGSGRGHPHQNVEGDGQPLGRAAADFVLGNSDGTNVAGSSGWLYFMVEK